MSTREYDVRHRESMQQRDKCGKANALPLKVSHIDQLRTSSKEPNAAMFVESPIEFFSVTPCIASSRVLFHGRNRVSG